MAGEFTTDMGVLAGIQELNNRFEWYYGDVEPVNPRPFLNWGHLSEDLWKQRNAENTDWIIRGNLSQSYFGLMQQSMIDIIDPLGHSKEYYGTTLPPRHLWVDGKTIGDAQSGATARANSDVYNLFAVLWDSVDNTNSQIKIYDSLGVLTEKGESAAADFAAHKKISLPDKRGRTSIGLDNMNGTSANIVTNTSADTLAGSGGTENQTISVGQLPRVTGAISLHSAPTATNIFDVSGAFSPGETIANSYRDGGTTLSGSSSIGVINFNLGGSGQGHNNMQPWVACNYIMRY